VHKLVAALTAALTFLSGPTAAAQDPTTSSSTTSSTVPADPVSIDVVGDSLTAQAHEYLGGWVDAPSSDTERIAEPGWDMDDAEAPYAASVAEDPPDVTVLALGPNDAALPAGWDLYDIVQWHGFLNDQVPEGSCLVLVLPRFGPAANVTWSREVNEARGYMVDLVSPGGQFEPPAGVTFVLGDHYLHGAARPDFYAADGIHLSAVDDNAPARARQDEYWDGVNSCPEGGT
jgi:hypothetical protein